MAISLPTTMTSYGHDNVAVTTINIGTQRFGGVFNQDLNSFSKLKAKYDDIKVSSMKENFTANIPSLTLFLNMEESKEGFFSGASEYSLVGANVKKDDEVIFKADRLTLFAEMTGYDVALYKKVQDEMRKILSGTQKETIRGSLTDTVTPSSSSMLSLFLDSFFKGSEGFSVRLNGDNIEIHEPSVAQSASYKGAPSTSSRNQMLMEHFNIALALSDLKKEKSALDISFGYAVPKSQIQQFANGSQLFSSLVPNTANINLGLSNIPLPSIVEMGQNSVRQVEQGQINPTNLKTQLLIRLPAMLTASGTQLDIRNLSLEGPDYNMKVEGTALANARATKMLTAVIDGKILGLSALTSSLKALPETQKILAYLSIMQMVGQKETDSDSYSYAFKLDDKGSMTLNGADLSTILGANLSPASGF